MNEGSETNGGPPTLVTVAVMLTLTLVGMVATGMFVNHSNEVKVHRFKSEAVEAGAAAYVCDPTTGVVRWEWRKCK